jgi:ABC-2 type transport system permease protein
MAFLRVRELVRKEFIQLFRDKKNRPLLFVAPILQLLLFGYVVTMDIRTITLGFLDSSKTPESRALMAAFTENRTFHLVFATDRPSELEEKLLKREIDLVLKIPPDFSARIQKGETAKIQILADGSMSNMAGVRISYANAIIDGYNQKRIQELHAFRMHYPRVDARIRTWYNPNLYSQNFFVPGIVAFLVMILTLLLTSMAIIKEREAGTMEQLMVTPVRPYELILGKTIPYIVIAMVQMMVVTVFAVFWFEIPLEGSLLLLFFSACLFLLSTLGIGLFISTISKTQQQAMMTTFFFLLPFFMLSGFVFPIQNMPEVIQWLTCINPLRFFLVVIRGIFLKGVGLSVLWPQLLAMGILGLVVFTGAVTRFKKRLD